MNAQHEFNEKFRAYVCERHPDWSDHFVPSGGTDPEQDFVGCLGDPLPRSLALRF
jgi:hypothetical protein